MRFITPPAGAFTISNPMSLPTLLLFPNYLGGGFGHTGRCLALAETWRAHGGNAVFALGGPHVQRVREAGFEVHELRTPRYTAHHNTGLAYVHVSDMAYQVARDGFDHPRVVRQALEEARQIVRRTSPQVLVGDGYVLTRLIGRQNNLPVVQIAKSVAHPRPAPLVWWETTPTHVVAPDIAPVFGPVFEELGLPPLNRATDLLDGDLLLLPSILPLDPMRPLPPKTYYVGPMVRQEGEGGTPPPDWLLALEEEGRHVVYVTVGGASGIAGDKTFFRLVSKALGEQPYQVVISTGGLPFPDDIPLPSNIRLVRWISHRHILPRARGVVFHGGYTRMEILLHGLPSVVIPFHTEQEYYARLMQRAGASIMLPYSTAPYQRLNVRWRGGLPWKQRTYSLHVRTRVTLQPETLREAVEAILQRPSSLRASAGALQQSLRAMNGAEQARGLIARHFSPALSPQALSSVASSPLPG